MLDMVGVVWMKFVSTSIDFIKVGQLEGIPGHSTNAHGYSYKGQITMTIGKAHMKLKGDTDQLLSFGLCLSNYKHEFHFL